MLAILRSITTTATIEPLPLILGGIDLNCVMIAVLGVLCGLVPLVVAHYGKPRRWLNQDKLALLGVVWAIALGLSFWAIAGQMLHPVQFQSLTLMVLGLAVSIGALYLRMLICRLPQLAALPDINQLVLVNQVLQREVQDRTQITQELQAQNGELTERLHLCTEELRRTTAQLQATTRDRDRTAHTLQSLTSCGVRHLTETPGPPDDSTLQAIRSQLVCAERMSGLGRMVMKCINDLERSLHNTQQDLAYLQFYAPHREPPAPSITTLRAAGRMSHRPELPTIYESLNLEIRHINATVEALGQFAQLQDEQAQPVCLHSTIAAVLQGVAPRLHATATRPAITVNTHYDPLPLVMGCAGQLHQVFGHLLANAIDAIDAASPAQPHIQITTEQSQRHVYLRFTDNGIGMMPHMLKRLFEPFYTTKSPGQGVGLGLALCYQMIVDYHYGQIQCHSTYRRGTTFEIVLPLVESPIVATIDSGRSVETGSRRSSVEWHA